MNSNFNKNRILKNSLLLYVRMLFTMWLNLYATRLVLKNLGIEEMGVYGVIGSIVSTFSVLNGGVTTAIQRFITFELGKREKNINSVFCSSLNVIFILAVILLLLLETVGLWVLYNKVNIPAESISAAFWVFQLSVLTCIVNLISVPYNALIIAHEKMNAFAFISILQVVLTCASAYCLSFFESDRLFIYALLMAIAGIATRIVYQLYCHIKFPEAKYRFILNKSELKQISKFAGVSTASGILQVIANQGIVFVINWTFGVAINAVYAIALQLKNSILSFALNLLKAIAPQITKTYASGEMETHKKLVYTGSKMEVFLIYFIMIPFLFRTEYILGLWLGEVPAYTVAFAQCTVFISLTYAAFEPIRTAVLATNKVSKFMIIPESFYLLILPVSYIASKLTANPVAIIASVVTIDILTCILRVYYASKVTDLKVRVMVKQVVLPCLYVGVAGSLVCYALSSIISKSISGLIFILLLNSLILVIIIYTVGISRMERKGLLNIISS